MYALRYSRSANDKVCTAAAIYPDATAIVSPSRALGASRIAALPHQPDTTARVHCTVVPSAVFRRAGNGLAWAAGTRTDTWTRAISIITTDGEVCAAAVIDPDTTAIVSPAIALGASRIAALPDQPDAATRVDRAEIASAIIR
jgi:hypothetical protein